MQDNFEMVYSTKEVSEKLKIADSSLRKYCLALEAEGYEFRKQEEKNGQRIFFERDIDVIAHFKVLLDAGQNMKNAANMIMTRIREAEEAARTAPVLVTEPFSERSHEAALLEKFQVIMQAQVAAAVQAELKKQQALPDPSHLRQQRVQEHMTHRRLEWQLEDEAERKWNELPEADRLMKSGFLGLSKREDEKKRERFIKRYVQEHYEERLRQQFAGDETDGS